MNTNDKLGDRMKMFESVPKSVLMHRVPVIIRIDGKAFHTFTKGFIKPFDDHLTDAMIETTRYLCEHVQGCVFGYTQSDEITLVLCDYQTYTTSAWFDNEVQKLCSVSASMATMAFNKAFADSVNQELSLCEPVGEDAIKLFDTYKARMNNAMFDARCFNLPKEEVTNCIIWRQKDAERNSMQSVGQAHFSHKELQGMSCDDIRERLFLEEQYNYETEVPTYLKRGTAVYKNEIGQWVVDKDMPTIVSDRNFVEKHIHFDHE